MLHLQADDSVLSSETRNNRYQLPKKQPTAFDFTVFHHESTSFPPMDTLTGLTWGRLLTVHTLTCSVYRPALTLNLVRIAPRRTSCDGGRWRGPPSGSQRGGNQTGICVPLRRSIRGLQRVHILQLCGIIGVGGDPSRPESWSMAEQLGLKKWRRWKA